MTLYESKVAKQFDRLGIAYYLPMTKVVQQWSDRIKKYQVPAFPSYIFVNIDNKDRNEVFLAKGASHYVRIENEDAELKEEAIRQIRALELEFNNKQSTGIKLKEGSMLTIKQGLFRGYTGIFRHCTGKFKVILQLNNAANGISLELPLNDLILH